MEGRGSAWKDTLGGRKKRALVADVAHGSASGTPSTVAPRKSGSFGPWTATADQPESSPASPSFHSWFCLLLAAVAGAAIGYVLALVVGTELGAVLAQVALAVAIAGAVGLALRAAEGLGE